MCKINAIGSVMENAGIPHWGVAAFKEFENRLLRNAQQRKLPEKACSIIVAIFPYYSGNYKDANLSKYAIPEDYHKIAGRFLEHAKSELIRIFPGFSFAPFCDSSPIPEVEAARQAGLGCVGRHGLLINPDYGSYVFIGEIVTNLDLVPSKNPGGACTGCGLCVKACPAQVCGGLNKAACVSAVTQKKGTLALEEQQLIKDTCSVWGCDICQDVCPLNKSIRKTEIEDFKMNLKTRIGIGELENNDFLIQNKNRAFMWRGVDILKRNIGIIGGDKADNKNKIRKEC